VHETEEDRIIPGAFIQGRSPDTISSLDAGVETDRLMQEHMSARAGEYLLKVCSWVWTGRLMMQTQEVCPNKELCSFRPQIH
jgi:hypothetical protein